MQRCAIRLWQLLRAANYTPAYIVHELFGSIEPSLSLEICQLHDLVVDVEPEAADFLWNGEDIEGTGALDAQDLQLCLGDIKEANNGLFDLVPWIEEIYDKESLASSSSGDQEAETIPSSGVLIPAAVNSEEQFYYSHIVERFPHIKAEPAKKLAQLNWLRHQRVSSLNYVSILE